MDTSIETIYRQVAAGSLSKAEALARLRELGLTNPASRNAPANGVQPTSAPEPRFGASKPAPAPRARRTLTAPTGVAGSFTHHQGPPKRSLTRLSLTPAEECPRISTQTDRPPEVTGDSSGVYLLRVNPDGAPATTPGRLEAIARCLTETARKVDARAIVLTGEGGVFLAGDLDEDGQRPLQECLEALRACELPVIAAVEGRALGPGCPIASLCDQMVFTEASRYGFENAKHRQVARERWSGFLRERFGDSLAERLLGGESSLGGADLAQYGRCLTSAPAGQAEKRAMELARELASYPRASLSLLKVHLARKLQPATSPTKNIGRAEPLAPGPAARDPWEELERESNGIRAGRSPLPEQAVETTFRSDVVRLFAYPDGVLLARLEDRASKNSFSPALTRGIQDLFEFVRTQPSHRALVLTGHDQYFATGGTKQGLLSIQRGAARYSDAPMYELPLRCEIPVIAAMQGHAIGAGWSFALFADRHVLAEESLYSSRFMRYGFTPGFGSTLIFPERFGYDLGREILLAAREYTGGELRGRGAPMPVAPRTEVLARALELARILAKCPRERLVQVKRAVSRPMLEALPGVVQAELEMHEQTFVRNPEALREIELHFDAREPDAQPVANPETRGSAPAPAAVQESDDALLGALRDLLAEELNLTSAEIEPDVPFTDLGLDSITGVSWVRRIGKRFNLALSANEIYQAPTLADFTRLVRKRLGGVASEATAAPEKPNAPAPTRPSPPSANHRDEEPEARPQEQSATASAVVEKIASAGARSDSPSAPVARPAEVQTPARNPLSEGQKGLWLLQRLDPDMAAYNVPVAFRIRDEAWGRALEPALEVLLAKHPMLRTVVAADERGEPYQYVPTPHRVRIEQVAIDAGAEADLISHLSAAFKQPFRLDHDPLLRVQVVANSKGARVVLFTLHHLFFDGTSLAIFLRDLLDIWARAAGGSIPRAPEPVTPLFFDFVQWEQSFLRSDEGARDLAYWKEHLAGELPISEFPADRVRSARRAYAGATVSSRLPAGLSERLRELAKQRRVSLFTLLLAVYKILLARYSREEAVVVGVPVARRPDARFNGEIGYFVNMVTLKSEPGADASFAEYLERLKWIVLAGLDHSRLPFARIVSELGIEPDPVRSPLFQTVFVLQNFLPQGGFLRPDEPGLGVEPMSGLHQEGEYDVRFEVIDQDRGLEVSISYDADVFERGTVERLIEHYRALAECVAHAPEARIADYSLLSATERDLVERKWNPENESNLPELCLHEVFEQRAKERPQAVALISAAGRRTYGEVLARASTLAAWLQARGIRTDERIALCLRRSPELVVGALGILQAGAAYVPIDPEYPAERIAFLIEDSDAKHILTDAATAPHVAAANPRSIPTLRVDADWDKILNEGTGRPLAREVRDSNLAYVLYTSGSTGMPKGVMVEHRHALSTLRFLEAAYPVGPNDAYLLKTNTTFDVSLTELCGWFVGSGRLAILPAGDERLPDRIAEAVRAWNVTHINFVPSALGVFLESATNAGHGSELESLKFVMVAGEAFPKDMVAEAVRAFPRARVENLYGPTEAAIYASFFSCSTAEIRSINTPIGKPTANARLYVLDRSRRSTGVGVPGELAIGGAGVARGYLNRPELTAAAFVADPFVPGGRLFLTGDLVRWLPEGEIEYFGRIDHQVKVRGFRVEPGEIEGLLNQHEGVQTSVVLAVGQGAARRLVAYYVPRAGLQAVAPSELIERLEARLPDYMVPRHYVPIDAIPLTSSGKVDRRSLTRREVQVESAADTRPPQGATEERIATVWKDLLQLDAVNTTDRFFEVGGTSLTAVILAERLSREFQQAIPAATVFKHSTVGALAQQLQPAKTPIPASASPRTQAPALGAPEPDTQPAYLEDCVAIVGMSCAFPGANNLRQFWSLLREGRDGGRLLSPEELRQQGLPETLIRDPKFVPLSLAVEEKDLFDPDFFNLPARNAFLMDPQFRQLLMHAWRAVEDAGYDSQRIPKTGVFMSAGNSFYQQALDRSGVVEPADAYPAWVLGQGGTIPALVAYSLGFSGPSLFVLSNCSSSLAGLHLACQSLRSGESQYALVGGATLFTPSRVGYLHRPGLNFSSDGRCKTFDVEADGMVGGEGVAVILIKRAKEALADGDDVYALIRGVAANNDGPDRAGFYSPGARGQTEVIDAALRSTAVDPETIGYLEAHGTGTRLGDPIEVMALTDAYRRHTSRRQFCGIGSVKSNIGHADTAAGLAGCIKLALSLREGTLPPSINYRTPNPAIDFGSSPFFVVDRSMPWPERATPRRAALSSFGIGGANVHAILEECPEAHRSRPSSPVAGPFLVLLSARTAERLRESIANLQSYVESPKDVNLADLAYTLAVGRRQMEARVALIAHDRSDLLRKLRQALQAQSDADAVWFSQPSGSASESLLDPSDAQALAKEWWEQGKLEKLARLWRTGVSLETDRWFAGQGRRRIHLPTYPFARERFAIEPAQPSLPVAPAVSKTGHPLLHENVSTLRELAFTTTLAGSEFFLSDHKVGDRMLLPGVVFLELASAAAASMNGRPNAAGLRLRDAVWLRPCFFDGETRTLKTSVRSSAPGRVELEVRAAEAPGEPTVCFRTAALTDEPGTPALADIPHLRQTIAGHRRSSAECYERFAGAGFRYGEGFRAVQELWLGSDQALARLRIPEGVASTRTAYALHPSLLDGALQACALLSLEAGPTGSNGASRPRSLGFPFSVREVQILRACPADAWAWIRPAAGSRPDDRLRKFDLTLTDDQGNVCVQLLGYCARAAEAPTSDPTGPTTLQFQPGWAPKAAIQEGPIPYDSRRLVWTCGVAHPQSATVDCRLLAPPSGALGAWFLGAASQIYSEVQKALRHRAATIVQLAIPLDGPAACLSAVAALFRAARLENPRFFGQVIQVDPDLSRRELADTLALESRCPSDPWVRHEDGIRSVPTWVEAQPAKSLPPSPWSDEGVYLITGGAGGLGRLFARDILDHAPRARVLLLGRSKAPAALFEAGSPLSDRIAYYSVDLAREDDVVQFLREVRASCPRIDGILHAAGVVQDRLILGKSVEEFGSVLAPKVLGSDQVERLARELNASFVAYFSSGVGWFGGEGQADYAAANAFLDRRAALFQSAAGGPRRISIAWPLWQEGGMRAEASRLAALQRSGLSPMPAHQGLAAFAAALASGDAHRLVLSGEPARLRELLNPPASAPVPATPKAPDVPLLAGTGPELEAEVFKWVRQTVAGVAKCPSHQVEDDTPFEKCGIDSILQVSIIEQLEETAGELAKTLLFEYSTPRELVGYLVKEHAETLRRRFAPASQPAAPTALLQLATSRREPPPAAAPEAGPDRFPPVTEPARGEGIAIIGIGGRYPMANSLDELWERLKTGENCVSQANGDRWPSGGHSRAANHGERRTRHGGFLTDTDRFDHTLFGIPADQVGNLSPETRLFLETAWETFENAGYARAALKRSQQQNSTGIGVFVGVMYNQYALQFAEAEEEALRSNATEWHIANRVSHFFDLTGPSLAVNSACSSSLLAIHLACESLEQGTCSMALAGGVNLTLHPSKYDFLQAANMLDDSPISRSFGAGQGYVPGEGVGAVLLKPLKDALRDGDRVLGVIKAHLASHAGGRQAYTAPDPQQQARLISACLRRAGVEASAIGCVESAANGSPLGDPIEVLALKKVFGSASERPARCALGSVKSNLGHLEAASGISQLTKVLLQLEHRTWAPSVHSRPRNPAVRLESSPFFIPEESGPWPAESDPETGRELPRRALVDSIGAGGTCVSLVVEEAPSQLEPAPRGQGPQLLVLSAATEPSLRASAERLAAFLRRGDDTGLEATAQTLLRREPLVPYRAAVIAASVSEAAELLELLGARGVEARASGLHASADGSGDPPTLSLGSNDLPRLAAHWIAGGSLTDAAAENGARIRPANLPPYAFDHSRSFAIGSEGQHPTPLSNDLAVAERIARGEMTESEFEEYLRQRTQPLSR